MSQHKCKDCKFWDCESFMDDKNSKEEGWCLRFPPIAVTQEQSGHTDILARMNNWPLTAGTGWCGEYEPSYQTIEKDVKAGFYG